MVYCIVLSEVEFEMRATYVSCRVVYCPLLVSHAVLLLNDMRIVREHNACPLSFCLSVKRHKGDLTGSEM